MRASCSGFAAANHGDVAKTMWIEREQRTLVGAEVPVYAWSA